MNSLRNDILNSVDKLTKRITEKMYSSPIPMQMALYQMDRDRRNRNPINRNIYHIYVSFELNIAKSVKKKQ